MNKELFQINDNIGAVTNEKGNLRVIYKENNNSEFKDILERENELESLKDEEKELSENLFSIKYGSFLSDLIILIGLIAGYFAFINGDLNFWTSMLCCYVPTKIVSLLVGLDEMGLLAFTRIGRIIVYFKKKKKYKELNDRYRKLDKELRNMQKKSQYLGDASHDFTPFLNQCLQSDIKMISLSNGVSSNRGKRRILRKEKNDKDNIPD